eukprot:2128145-Amphidinium_carterae.1
MSPTRTRAACISTSQSEEHVEQDEETGIESPPIHAPSEAKWSRSTGEEALLPEAPRRLSSVRRAVSPAAASGDSRRHSQDGDEGSAVTQSRPCRNQQRPELGVFWGERGCYTAKPELVQLQLCEDNIQRAQGCSLKVLARGFVPLALQLMAVVQLMALESLQVQQRWGVNLLWRSAAARARAATAAVEEIHSRFRAQSTYAGTA